VQLSPAPGLQDVEDNGVGRESERQGQGYHQHVHSDCSGSSSLARASKVVAALSAWVADRTSWRTRPRSGSPNICSALHSPSSTLASCTTLRLRTNISRSASKGSGRSTNRPEGSRLLISGTSRLAPQRPA